MRGPSAGDVAWSGGRGTRFAARSVLVSVGKIERRGARKSADLRSGDVGESTVTRGGSSRVGEIDTIDCGRDLVGLGRR